MFSDMAAQLRGMIFRVKCRLVGRSVIVGKGLKIFRKLEIYGKGSCIIGSNCSMKGMPGNRGQWVTIYSTNPEAQIRIGENVKLLAAKMTCKFGISIGNDVLIEEAALMDTDFHTIERPRKDIEGETRESCMIVIGDRVAIGARSIIGRGARIGADSVVVPNSVVRGVFPAGSFIIGNPARRVLSETAKD